MANINQMCRACLTSEEKFTYFLFDNVSTDVYCFCTSVEVLKKDDLPRSLCNMCYNLLGKYSEFKKTCIDSQNTLLDLKTKLKTEPHDFNVHFDSRDEIKHTDEFVETGDAKSRVEMTNISVKIEDVDEQFCDDFETIADFSHKTALNNKIQVIKRKKKKLGKVKGHKRKEKLKVPRKHFIFTCELCNKKFNYSERFEAHKLEHEGRIVSIACQPCNKTFMTWSGLRRHNENEHTQISLETLKCTKCGKLCKSRQTLKIHEKIHGERTMLVCDVCGKGFTTAVILKAHLETHKENRERQYTCEQCGKKFFTQSILLSHMSRRHSGRRFICQICSYPFTDKYNLAKHLLIHEGKKLYKCDVCSKSFGTQSSLVEHKRIHSGERPYSCTYCPKCFISRKGLTDHIRTHTGEKPYKCGVCNQGFSQSGSLRRHSKIHERVVPALTD